MSILEVTIVVAVVVVGYVVFKYATRTKEIKQSTPSGGSDEVEDDKNNNHIKG